MNLSLAAPAALLLSSIAAQAQATVDTLADLRALPPGHTAQALGHTAVGDGGDGLFVWVDPCAEADNGGTVIASTAKASGRWKRLAAEPLSVRWFGACGDGTHDDTAALQAALTTAAKGGGATISVPPGTYLVTSTLTIRANCTLLGAGGASVLKWGGGAWVNTATQIRLGTLLDITGKSNIRIADLVFDAAGADLQLIHMANGVDTAPLVIENDRFIHLSRASADNRYARSLAIALAGGRTITRNCYCDGAASDTFNYNSGWHLVANNIILNGEDGGIAFNNGAHGVISGNWIYNCDLGIGMGHPGTVEQSKENSTTITGNTIEQCMCGINMGWFGYQGKGAPRNWAISGNVFKSSATRDISYDGPTRGFAGIGAITGNTSCHVGSPRHHNFRHAERGNQTSAIFARLVNCDDVTISGNTIVDPDADGDLIIVGGSRNIVVANNLISVAPPPRQLSAVRLLDAGGVSVSGNRVSGEVECFLRSDSAAPLSDLHVNDNVVSGYRVNAVQIKGPLAQAELLHNRFTPAEGAGPAFACPAPAADVQVDAALRR
jgi:hypothetical protein